MANNSGNNRRSRSESPFSRLGSEHPRPELQRVLPRNIEAEKALLAAAILEGGRESVDACLESKIEPDFFYHSPHQLIYEGLLDLKNKGTPADEVTLSDALQTRGTLEQAGGAAYLAELTGLIETPGLINEYIRIVHDCGIARKLIQTSQRTIELALQGQEDIQQFVHLVEQEIFRLSDMGSTERPKEMGQMMNAAVSKIEFFQRNKGAVTGVPTGFRDLDQLTTGLHSPQMVVVAARPGMGKTSIALNMAEAAILPPKGEPTPTLMFSLEMGYDELAVRLLCSRARANMSRLRDGYVSRETSQDIATASKELSKAPLLVDDTESLTILQVRARARRLKERHKLGLIIVDYLQLLSGTDSRAARHEQIGEISRGIKGMAKELQVPVLALAQLNREGEKERRQPRISDLRESGSIEQDADIVLLLARKDAKEEEMADQDSDAVPRDLIIAKQRNGPTAKVDLIFRKSITRFENAAFTPSDHA